ncbi:MAG: diguanylate cyclase [Pseudomonadota bacterium]
MKQETVHTAEGAGRVCARYGFDAAARRHRLELLELGDADQHWAQRLQQEVIAPQVDALVERFYDFQQRFPEIMRAIGNRDNLARLKQTQRRYLLGLGHNFAGEDYFGERLRIGEIHALHNIPLSLYQASYRHLQQLLIEAIPAAIPPGSAEHLALCGFISKITALDMTLAIETYHSVRVADLRETVDSLQHEHWRLHEKVGRDALTGLANREAALNELDAALTAIGARGTELCLIMADVDHFKQINDTYGHLAGDKVLQCIAAKLQQMLREFDIVGRFGGEEFIIVLDDTPLEVARKVAERLRRGVEQELVQCDEQNIRLTISLGLTRATARDDVRGLIRRADDALYQAKEEGRNRVVVI